VPGRLSVAPMTVFRDRGYEVDACPGFQHSAVRLCAARSLGSFILRQAGGLIIGTDARPRIGQVLSRYCCGFLVVGLPLAAAAVVRVEHRGASPARHRAVGGKKLTRQPRTGEPRRIDRAPRARSPCRRARSCSATSVHSNFVAVATELTALPLEPNQMPLNRIEQSALQRRFHNHRSDRVGLPPAGNRRQGVRIW
jgi:hypothetical protein